MLNPVSANGESTRAPLLQAIGITKAYGTFLANNAIDLDLYPGEIHALLGENGAGKSTLVKTMYGLIQPTAGELRWMGEKIELTGPSDARSRGIAMVFQHFSLFDNLTVAENVALGLDGSETFAAMSARLAKVSSDYGLPLDPNREVWRLSVGERQRIEIVRALMQNPKLLILDEPTAVLTPQEADQLFTVLFRLKSEGRALLYISHKLDEVKRLCDTATILRGGKKVETCDPRQETAASMARMMVGAEIGEVKAAAGRTTTIPRLLINDLSMEPDDPHGVYLKGVTVEVKGGEILGIAGVAGNGQDELFSALSGERLSPHSDNVIVDGHAAGHLTVTQRRRLGAAFVPEERLGHGTAPRMKLSENALLTGHAASDMVHRGFVDRVATLATVDKTTTTFDVRKAKRDPEAASLSGGNLQKFIVGREILREPGVLIVSQPTWGVDAGAAAVIRQALLDLSSRGTAVLVISQDLDELAEIADRIAVMFHGHLSEPIAAADATREKLGLLMGGASVGDAAGQQEASHATGS
ncbi:MAG: ATP-binding cassette domain-containing protein [Rhodopseudomonas sp.]|nr:ATP-binding cassette domain-containing protein [Rhodopseudomonas sp.]